MKTPRKSTIEWSVGILVVAEADTTSGGVGS